jgi:hypothetical protein
MSFTSWPLTFDSMFRHSLAAIIPNMRLSIPLGFAFWACVAYGAVVHVPIKSSVVLKPNETYTATIEATEPIEIGWQAVQSPQCATNCVKATDLTGGTQYSISTPLGAAMKYKPVAGKISVEYKNVSSQPVTINVFRVRRTCDAEACKFLKNGEKGTWLVYKVDEFKSIATSKDESYSVISGVAVGGRHFTLEAVWWSDEKTIMMFHCATFIKRYLDNHTPKDQYRPYIISGQAIGEGDNIVLNSIDTCVPKAPNFGVPDKNVFK